jgi:hypothetical protein
LFKPVPAHFTAEALRYGDRFFESNANYPIVLRMLPKNGLSGGFAVFCIIFVV